VTGGVVFLLVAVALSVVGSLVLWLRFRQPTSLEHSVDAFSREMRALAPERPPRAARTTHPAGGDDAAGADLPGGR
jgi:hypothetical protein